MHTHKILILNGIEQCYAELDVGFDIPAPGGRHTLYD